MNCIFPFTANLYITTACCIEDMKIIFSVFRDKSIFFCPFMVKLGLYFQYFFLGVNKHTSLNTICSQHRLSLCARIERRRHAQSCNLDLAEVEYCIWTPFYCVVGYFMLGPWITRESLLTCWQIKFLLYVKIKTSLAGGSRWRMASMKPDVWLS